MVTIDENGNKVNVWTESRIDTATIEIMEMKHTRVLATADDVEHWHWRTICEENESLRLNQPTLFIYGSENMLQDIERLLECVAQLCDTLTKIDRVNINIPLSALLRVMVGDATAEGTLCYKSQTHTDTLALLTSCDIESAERLRDALFEIFPAVDYIEIYE